MAEEYGDEFRLRRREDTKEGSGWLCWSPDKYIFNKKEVLD